MQWFFFGLNIPHADASKIFLISLKAIKVPVQMCAEKRLSNFTGRKRHFNFVLNNVNYAILRNWLSLQNISRWNISRQNISHIFGGYLWRLNFSLCIFRPLKEKYNFIKPLLFLPWLHHCKKYMQHTLIPI